MPAVSDKVVLKGVPLALVHGFHETDAGKSSTDKLHQIFSAAGMLVSEFDQRWSGNLVRDVFMVRYVSPLVAENLTRWSLEAGDGVAIGYSNGCNIIHQACQLGARFPVVVLIAPALRVDATFPDHIQQVFCYHSPSDTPTLLARFLAAYAGARFGGRHPWGAAGRYGLDQRTHPTTGKPQVKNINGQTVFKHIPIEHKTWWDSQKVLVGLKRFVLNNVAHAWRNKL